MELLREMTLNELLTTAAINYLSKKDLKKLKEYFDNLEYELSLTREDRIRECNDKINALICSLKDVRELKHVKEGESNYVAPYKYNDLFLNAKHMDGCDILFTPTINEYLKENLQAMIDGKLVLGNETVPTFVYKEEKK